MDDSNQENKKNKKNNKLKLKYTGRFGNRRRRRSRDILDSGGGESGAAEPTRDFRLPAGESESWTHGGAATA